jgi:DNA-binding response OmpR family regulator
MDGPALCRAVRAGPHGRDLYFIMLTGNDSAVAQADGYESGIDAFTAKPCEPTDLLAALRTAIHRGDASAKSILNRLPQDYR